MTCAELEIEKNDTAESVMPVINARTEQYIVAKVPPTNTDVSLALQSSGFRYIETLFCVSYRIGDKKPLPDICRPFADDVSYHIADEAETERLLGEMSSGKLFSTDRIALDPYFTREAAGRRYMYWTKDVLASGKAKIVICDYCGKSIGFDIAVDKGKYIDMILGGLFIENLDSGLGAVSAYGGLIYAYDFGKKKVVSHVSSNNFQMLRIDLMLGNSIKSLTSNFIKHNDL